MAEPEEPEKRGTISLGSLASQVRDFWAATGIPLVELMLSVIVVSWCVVGIHGIDESISTAATHLSQSRGASEAVQDTSNTAVKPAPPPNGEAKEGSKGILELYGLSTILPVAALVVLLGAAQGLSAFLRMVGGTTPAHLTYRVEPLILLYVPPSTLQRAWARLGTAENVRMLSDRLDQEVRWSQDSPVARGFFRGSLQLQPLIDRLDSTRRFAVGLWTIGVLAWLLHAIVSDGEGISSQLIRLAIFLAVGVAAWGYLNVNFLRATRLYHYRKFADFVAWKEDADAGKRSDAQKERNLDELLDGIVPRMEEGLEALPLNRRLIEFVTRNTDLEFDMLAAAGKDRRNLADRKAVVKGKIAELRRRSTPEVSSEDPYRRR